MDDLIEAAKAVEVYTLEMREFFHNHPELRWREEDTLGRVKREVRNIAKEQSMNVDITEAKGGLWVDVAFNSGMDRVLLRADVDALQVQEETELYFASHNPGVMHACGHDIHAAMLLGAFKAIAEGMVQPRHNLRLVWQRAEEGPGSEPIAESGGHCLVGEGVCDGITQAYGLHILVGDEIGFGAFASCPGPFLCNSDRLRIDIKCPGGHVAEPHNGGNALRITQSIQNALSGFPVSVLGPLEPVTLEPTIIKAGTASNIMPASAEMWYGVRTFLPVAERDLFMEALETRITSVVRGFPGATVECTPILGHSALINSPGSYKHVSTTLEAVGQKVEKAKRKLGGEDFAYYLQQVTGSFWFLGANKEGSGPLHSPTFNPAETVFLKGVLFWLALATS